MVRYETLFLTVPEITSDEAATFEKQFNKAISDAQGAVLSFDRWGKYRLSYPIRNNEYGVYYLARFEVNDKEKKSLLDALKILFAVKYNELIMRDIIVHMDKAAPLEYRRPESLEETPSPDIDSLVKESKDLLGGTARTHEEVEA